MGAHDGLDESIGLLIERRSGLAKVSLQHSNDIRLSISYLVHDDDFGVAKHDAGETDELAVSSRERLCAGHLSVKAVGKIAHELAHRNLLENG